MEFQRSSNKQGHSFLGGKVIKTFRVALFLLAGLLSTWLSFFILSRLDLSQHSGGSECDGPCADVPLHRLALFVAFLIAPTLIHVAVGYFISPSRIRTARGHAVVLLLLAMGTMLFYLSFALAGHFIAGK
jgi:hypothetical protein